MSTTTTTAPAPLFVIIEDTEFSWTPDAEGRLSVALADAEAAPFGKTAEPYDLDEAADISRAALAGLDAAQAAHDEHRDSPDISRAAHATVGAFDQVFGVMRAAQA